MRTTRKKVTKTVYKYEDTEDETGDFSDSGSDAQISEPPTSDEEEIEENRSSADEFEKKPNKKRVIQPAKRKPFAKEFLGKINKQMSAENEETDVMPTLFTVRDLTDSDKLLPSVLNLSESDSSDDETPKPYIKMIPMPANLYNIQEQKDSDNEDSGGYTDVWGNNIHDNSAEIAKKTFLELEQHKNSIEETKASLQSYVPRGCSEQEKETNVKDLLALGEEVVPQMSPVKKKLRARKIKKDSESEVEDWEEVKESKAIPQQGLQLVVALPDSVCRKSKKIDVEMMMKRKINRVKKEHQVFMHKVHVLCWLGHGNYVSSVLNDQEIMTFILKTVPKGCYPKERLDMKYVEQITTWYHDKFPLKPSKYEYKYRPKAPPLKSILLDEILNKKMTAKRYLVFVFVAMLRALGLQCRVMFNFVTVPLKPPSSELCSLSTKPKDKKSIENDKEKLNTNSKATTNKMKINAKETLPQVDGIDDSFLSSDSEVENIMQLDGNNDLSTTKTRSLRSTRAKKAKSVNDTDIEEDKGVSPPKRPKKDVASSAKDLINTTKKRSGSKSPQTRNTNKSKGDHNETEATSIENEEVKTLKSPQSISLKKTTTNSNGNVLEKAPQKSASPHKTKINKTISDANKTITTKVYTDTESEFIENNKVKTFKSTKSLSLKKADNNDNMNTLENVVVLRKTRSNSKTVSNANQTVTDHNKKKLNQPKIIVTNEDQESTQNKYLDNLSIGKEDTKGRTTRKRSHTVTGNTQKSDKKLENASTKSRTKSTSGKTEKSKYFSDSDSEIKKPKFSAQQLKKLDKLEDVQRISHRDLRNSKMKPKNDVTGDLVEIIKSRIKGAKEEAKQVIVKGKVKDESENDSDYLPVEDPKHRHSESDEDFKPTKISPKAPKLNPGVKPSTNKKVDRRILSSDEELIKGNKVDVWCEIFVEELEQWVAVDVVKGKVHCAGELYSHATHPVCYIVGWDNNNFLKDLTRRYVPHWNTVTRKQRAEPEWWQKAIQPWLGPRNARDREEDDTLDRMQLEAPLPKSIAEYKNHPLYALKRHLLKFEAIYPADAATLGFVRNEPVYARRCVYTCRSRDTWLKEAKTVKLGEKPYKVVKARPKWDKLSNKLITDKPLEVFGPWQVQDYEPPTAENGIVPRNAYGNVELFKDCMLPKGTVHIKLPGLNKVARKLNIDCAPAMTGFDFNGGWSHPVYDGFVVCKEYEEVITEAWVKDQEEMERREREKIELRVYGNWKRLIKGLLIRERLKVKYGFEEPSTSKAAKNKSKGPRLVTKKKN